GDANIQFTLDLTDKGRKLLAAKTFKGSLLVIVENEASGKVFTNALPLTLKLGFGGEVDVEDCLLVQPVTWDAFVGTKERKQQAFEIKNTCTVKGVPVRLTDLAVKVKQLAGNSLGTFTGATTQETKTLGAAYETVLDAIPANGEAIVTITFAPGDILSGVAQPQIVFRATNLTGTGFPDHLEKTVTMNLVVNDLTQCVRVNAPPILEIETCALNTGFSQMSNYYNQVYRPTGVPYFNPGFQTLNQTSNPSGTSAIPSNITYGSPFFTGTYPGAYGPGGVDGFGNMGPYSAQFTPQSANYFAGAQGPFANPNFDRYNYAPGAGGQFGCAGTEFRIENACQSEVQIVLDVDPNLQSSQGTFSLKPTQTQRVFVQPGYRIGKYGVNVNARAQGSTDPSTEVAFISVLVRSPTEVNQDCISLNTTKYRFNDFIQKPVKGKVYNNCYDEGVRLVPSADTVTIASLKDAKGNTTLDPKQGVSQQPNSLVQDIQIIGISTQGDGRDTVQVLEFQIFPDLTTYQHQLSPFDQGGSFPKQVLDLKFFAELNYYRVESYGTISVKYLDPYGGPQQKPFPVIFENLFNLASAINPLLQGGSESITNYSECVNEDALRFRAIGTDTGAAALEFGDAEFQGQTILTHTTKAPNAVLKTGIIDGKEFCGQVDYIRSVTPTILTSRQNPSVQAIFSVSGKHDLQVQINRPLNLTQEAVIEGILTLEVTRTIANPGTQKVSLPVRIVIKPVGKPSTAIFTPQACTETGYEKGPGFVSKYGFDRLTWDWTYEGSPDCTQYFCDATQFMIFTSKRLKEFDTFVKANQASGLFSDADKDYTSQNFVLAIHDQITVTDDQTTGKPTRSFFVNSAGDGVVKETTSSQSAKLLIDNVFTALSNAPNLNEVPADYTSYVAFVKQKFEEIQNNAAGNKLAEQLVIVLDADKVSRLVATGIKGMGADEVTFPNGEKKYVWLFSEFRHFFDESNKINPTLCGTDCWALASLTQPGDSHQFTPGVYRAIYDAVESVQVGMLVPTDTEAEAWDAARLGYVLSHARQKGGLTFQDTAYADIDSLRGRFVDMNVYMMQDAFSQFLLSDLAFVSGEGYDYPAAFNNQMLTNLDIIQRMLISPPVPEAGLYPASFVATWENDSDGVK
ncbi:MAG: hypothetical protein U1C71_00770, partial [archaeon]|nr:hypothetical protein [archaeon]